MLDALVIAPHPDDAELGMGGTIALMLAQGLRVGVLDLTNVEPTPLGSPAIRAQETAAATAVLGIPWRENLGLPNRQLRASLKARGMLAGVIRRTRPRWLFSPHWIDAHPDHTAATRLVDAARFWAKLTKFDLTSTWELKRRSIACYASHFPPSAPQPNVLQRVEAAAHWWGAMSGGMQGEAFTTREPIGLRSFGGLF